MTRTQTILLTTALALTVPLAAIAQTASSSMKCGPVAFSARDMSYSSGPCTGATAGAVGPSGPTVTGANNSTTMTKAEMKQGGAYGYAPMPMQAQAVSAGANMGYADQSCSDLRAATIKDEYGRRYNCRGDRIR
jgi:hypothetical protein